jgi:hypothetical protein
LAEGLISVSTSSVNSPFGGSGMVRRSGVTSYFSCGTDLPLSLRPVRVSPSPRRVSGAFPSALGFRRILSLENTLVAEGSSRKSRSTVSIRKSGTR